MPKALLFRDYLVVSNFSYNQQFQKDAIKLYTKSNSTTSNKIKCFCQSEEYLSGRKVLKVKIELNLYKK